MKEKNDNKEESRKSKINIKKYLKQVVAILICIVVISLMIFGIYKGIIYLSNMKYKQYEENMNSYGFSKLYNNTSPKSYQYITKSEAIKIIVSATLKTNDISPFIDIENKEYSNYIWVEYAKSMGIISQDSITAENENDKETYINIIEELANSRKILLNKETPTNVDISIKNYDKFSNSQKDSIKNLIFANIIENTNKKINGNAKVTKGMLNKLIVDYVQKDNLLTIDGATLNTDKSKMPSNANDYPYSVEDVDSSVYEIKKYYFLGVMVKDSIEVYETQRQNYNEIKNVAEQYLNTLFNIDYKTMNYEDFSNKINENLNINTDEEKLRSYIDYVKTNEIVISGEAKFQEPIVYYDGMRYRARIKVSYNIQHAINLKNLIYLDDDSNEELIYNLGNNEVIYDIPLVNDYGNYCISEFSLSNSIAGKVVDVYMTESTDPVGGID